MKDAKRQLQKIPSSPGVYFFKNTRGEIIYIGKAVNLKARVKSYFSQKLYGLKATMIPEISKINYKITDTEIDALILESQYIKKHRPRYNVMLKDDKNYFYVVITNDKFPKIFLTHQPAKSKYAVILGPYTDGTALKTTLRFLRKIFPYCTCKTQHKLPCLKAHLGLCLGICCAYSTDNLQPTTYNRLIKTYNKNIKSIIDILSGKKKNILAKLGGDMNAAAKKENFEKAAEIRNKITALKNVFEHKIMEVEPQYHRSSTSIVEELKGIFGGEIGRIEFYDISNIQGQLASGSMVVFDGEKINKSEYKKFKIKTVHQADDPAMMKEVLERRLKHVEWPIPDLIIVDGGITQLNAAKSVLAHRRLQVVSLAKNPDRLFLSPLKAIALKDLPENTRLFLQNLRDEAHRFAIGYHKKLRSKRLKNEFSY